MRVALVVERFEPGAGGVESVAWNVAHGLARAGDDVRVIARRADVSTALPVTRVRVPTAWQPWRVLAFSRAAHQAALRAAPDVVQSFSRTRRQDVYRAGGGCHADYLVHRHGVTGALARRLSPRHAVLLWMESRIFADPHQTLLCNSQRVRDALARRYPIPPSRLVVLRNGVDLERFHPHRRAEGGARMRAAHAPGQGLVWLFAGSGWSRKGLDTALAALARRPEARLWVAGGDAPAPWRAHAARLGVEGRVVFLGRRDDLEDVYAGADALVLPTRYDAFANVCLEAAASGLPVVTSAANGAAEILGDAGRVVADAGDAAGFAAALAELADADMRAHAGRAGRRLAEAHGWDAHVDALRRLYRERKR